MSLVLIVLSESLSGPVAALVTDIARSRIKGGGPLGLVPWDEAVGLTTDRGKKGGGLSGLTDPLVVAGTGVNVFGLLDDGKPPAPATETDRRLEDRKSVV